MGFRYAVALELQGRRCVVVGGGTVAEHKVQGLLDAGAQVTVVADTATPGLEELARRGRLTLVRRRYEPGDLEEAFLAIAATDDRRANAEIFAEATERGVLLNAVDDAEHCHFAAPSVLRRGDLSISISTGGKAPALAKRLRASLSEQFGPEWGALVDVLAEARAEAIGERDVDFGTWAERWQLALDHDLVAMVRDGRGAEAREVVRRLLAEGAAASGGPEDPAAPGRSGGFPSLIEDSAPNLEGAAALRGPAGPTPPPSGSVAIVGAGPGDPDLISVRGRRLLDAADVVVHDRLVHPSLWEGKAAIDAGKQPGAHRVDQEQINAMLVRLAGEGKRVVRLKGGDPFVFGRGAEEAEALAGAGVPFEVVPAPTSAVAAAASAGIPVTDRRWSSSVAIVTGHCATGDVDWAALATAVDTIVVLMGLGRLGEIAERLVAGGRSPHTPAAVVENGSLPTQRVVTAELGELPAAAAEAGISPPALIVIGDVVRVRDRIAAPLGMLEKGVPPGLPKG